MTTMTAPSLTLDVPSRPGTRGRWLRWVLWSALALMVLASIVLFTFVDDLGVAPLDITINGTSLATGLDVAALPAAHKLALAVLVALAMLSALLLALAAIVLVLVALVPVLLLSVGVPVLVGGVVLLALLSPLIVLAWCLWRMLRPRPATMAS